MNDTHLPTAAVYPLPPALQRLPEDHTASAETSNSYSHDLNALCEALEPLISAAIARKARQRRYTP